MLMRRVQGIGLALLLGAQLFGCAGEAPLEPPPQEVPAEPPARPPTDASNQLSANEALVIGDEFVEAAVAGLNWGLTVAKGVNVAARLAGKTAPKEIDLLIDRSHACEGGGTIDASGSLSGTIDPGNRRVTLMLEETVSANSCRTTFDRTGFTVNSHPDPSITGDFSWEGAQRSGTFKMAGGFVWEADDGRSGRCDLTFVGMWLADGSWSVTGTVCNHELSRSV